MIRMKMALTGTLMALVLFAAGTQGQAGWSIGVGIAGPAYYRPYAPCYYPYYPYYPYRPVYLSPPPVVVESAPVVLQPLPAPLPAATFTQPSGQPPSQPTPSPLPASVVRAQAQEVPPTEIARCVQQLRDPDERVRTDSVLQLGRLRALSAVDSVAATLAGDRSPMVREAAARALGLMGSPKALPALQHAALTDPDRDVRHSAQFAVDIVQSGH
jgi:HEAT repeats